MFGALPSRIARAAPAARGRRSRGRRSGRVGLDRRRRSAARSAGRPGTRLAVVVDPATTWSTASPPTRRARRAAPTRSRRHSGRPSVRSSAASSISASSTSIERNPRDERQRQPDRGEDRREHRVEHGDDRRDGERAEEAVDVRPGTIHAATSSPIAETIHVRTRSSGRKRRRLLAPAGLRGRRRRRLARSSATRGRPTHGKSMFLLRAPRVDGAAVHPGEPGFRRQARARWLIGNLREPDGAPDAAPEHPVRLGLGTPPDVTPIADRSVPERLAGPRNWRRYAFGTSRISIEFTKML